MCALREISCRSRLVIALVHDGASANHAPGSAARLRRCASRALPDTGDGCEAGSSVPASRSGTTLASALCGGGAAPGSHLLVVATAQHFGDFELAKRPRARVLRILEQPAAHFTERTPHWSTRRCRAPRAVVECTPRPRTWPADFAASEHEVAERQLFIDEVPHAFVDALVAPADQDQRLALGQRARVALRETRALRA